MTRWQQRFNKRVREVLKEEKGKSQIKRGDMMQAWIIIAKLYSKNWFREAKFLMQLADKHEAKRSSKVGKSRR